MRRTLLVVVLVAIAGSNSVEDADGGVHMLESTRYMDDGDVSSLGSEGLLGDTGEDVLGRAGKVKTVLVPVKPKPAKAPQPTVEALTPKHEMKKTAEFIKKNKGAKPSKAEVKEIKRVAVAAAAEELNNSDQKKAALKKTKRSEKKLTKKIARDEKNMQKVADNLKIVAERKARTADRNLKVEEDKVKRKELKREAAEKDAEHSQFEAKTADKNLRKVESDLQHSKLEHVRLQKQVEANEDSVIKAHLLLAKDKGLYEDAVKTKRDKDYFLEHIEDHEE